MSLLVSAILYRSLRLAGVLGAPGRGPSATQLGEALDIANAMLDSWNTERLIIYEVERNVQTVTSGKQDYSISATQVSPDWAIERPTRIERAGLIYLANPSQPLELPMDILTTANWSQIPVKNISSTIPLQLWYEPSFPAGVAHLWPKPSMDNSIALYLWKQLAQFTGTGQTVSFPPGYLKAITYNVAMELATLPWEGHNIKPSPMVAQIAVDSKAKIKALNIGIIDLSCDEALVSRMGGMYNIYTDSQRGGPY